MRKVSLPPDSSATESRLLGSALSLLARRRYDSVSVAEICREAGLSNGVFYRYFAGKEELARRLLDRAADLVRRALLAATDDPDAGRRLGGLAQSLAGCGDIDPELLAVLHEGRSLFPDFGRMLGSLHQDGLSRALGREATSPEIAFALGGPRHCAVRRALRSVPIDGSTISAIVLRGLFPGLAFDEDRVFATPEQPTAPGAAARSPRALLEAGRLLFSTQGFSATNVHEIADAAGCSVGAFYLRHASKDEFYGELARAVYADLEGFVTANLPEGLNRLERETRRLWLFAIRVRAGRGSRRLLQEAEFVTPAETDAFREDFVSTLLKHPLSEPGCDPGLDRRTVAEFLLGLAQCLGIDSDINAGEGSLRAEISMVGRLLSGGIGRSFGQAG